MNSSDFVTLTDGFIVPLAVLQVLWDLENRGIRIRLDDQGIGIVANPRTLLTDEDRAAVRRYRQHIIDVVRYCERQPALVQ